MTDTQWPRYEVFLRTEEGKPLQHAGSVHAPDSELAVLNARDVFVRRPKCLLLWVVPADRMIHRTSEELAQAWPANPPSGGSERRLYHVFRKESQRGTLVFAASIESLSAWDALKVVTSRHEGLAWAVFPQEAVTQNGPRDRPSFFEPALDKDYRLHGQYKTIQLMRQVEARKKVSSTGEEPAKPGKGPRRT
jgi:ring-1,2-phenylacetyl-CoA epoxidase subunit PaaB